MDTKPTLDELFERRITYPDIDPQARLARLVGLDEQKNRLAAQVQFAEKHAFKRWRDPRRLTLGHIEYGVLFIASARRIKQEYAKRTTRTVEFFGSNKANVFPFVIFNSPEVAKNQTLGVKRLTRECTHEV